MINNVIVSIAFNINHIQESVETANLSIPRLW